MAKYFQYWVIVTDAVPTAFRSRRVEDLMPTLKQLQRTQPNVSLKWFERGRFWDSPEAARDAQAARRRLASDRGRSWRPGGSHEDPRARYDVPRDVRRARFKERLKTERRPLPEESGQFGQRDRREGEPGRREGRPDNRWRPAGKPPGRPHSGRPEGERGPRGDRARGPKPGGPMSRPGPPSAKPTVHSSRTSTPRSSGPEGRDGRRPQRPPSTSDRRPSGSSSRRDKRPAGRNRRPK